MLSDLLPEAQPTRMNLRHWVHVTGRPFSAAITHPPYRNRLFHGAGGDRDRLLFLSRPPRRRTGQTNGA